MPGNGQVALSWAAAARATSYNVKRSTTSGGPYTTVGTPTATTFTNTGLTNGTTYFFVVSAVNAVGQSANSAQVSAAPQATQTPNFTLSANPASVTVARGASATSTIGIARTAFTTAVGLAASGLPSGVTASFNPASATGTSSTLTFTASATAATGTSTVTVTGTGGGLTRTTAIALTVSGGGTGDGGVTVTPMVTTSSPWFNEQQVRVTNTAPLTALSITVVVQRTAGISHERELNTVGGQITQANSSTATAITYTFSLAAGQTLGTGNGRTFAAQTRGAPAPSTRRQATPSPSPIPQAARRSPGAGTSNEVGRRTIRSGARSAYGRVTGTVHGNVHVHVHVHEPGVANPCPCPDYEAARWSSGRSSSSERSAASGGELPLNRLFALTGPRPGRPRRPGRSCGSEYDGGGAILPTTSRAERAG